MKRTLITLLVLSTLVGCKTNDTLPESSLMAGSGSKDIPAEAFRPFLGDYEFVGPEHALSPTHPLDSNQKAIASISIDRKKRVALSMNFYRRDLENADIAPGMVILYNWQKERTVETLPVIEETDSSGTKTKVARHVITHDLAWMPVQASTDLGRLSLARYQFFRFSKYTAWWSFGTGWGDYERREAHLTWSSHDDLTFEQRIETTKGKRNMTMTFKRRR